jgi:hypothetical protein
MSWIQLPSECSALATTEEGGLQLATEHGYELYIWSTKDADEVDARWEQNKVIKLNTLLPVHADFTSLSVVGSTDDLSTIFVSVKDVAYAIDLKTDKVKKVYEGTTKTIVPYMSFYTPGTALLGFWFYNVQGSIGPSVS